MLNINQRSSRWPGFLAKAWWLAPIPLFAAVAACCLPWFRYGINPDGVSYICIAREYLAGDFTSAVNTFWSPLYSWLLCPLLALGIEPVLACKVLGVLIGSGTLAATAFLCGRLALPAIYRFLVLIAITPLVMWVIVYAISPDLLLGCLLLLYLAMMVPGAGHRYPRPAAGLVGGVAYLAKAYALPFVVVHYSASLALLWMRAGNREHRRAIAVAGMRGLMLFVVVAGSWVAVISHRLGHFSTSAAGPYNFAQEGPGQRDHRMLTEGLIPPASRVAISVWEDPGLIQLPAWNPIGSAGNLRHELHLLRHNIADIVVYLLRYSTLAMAAVGALAIVSLRQWRRPPATPWLIMLLALAIYLAGYMVFHVELRYLFFALVLAVVLAAGAVHEVGRTRWPNADRWRVAIVALIAATCIPRMVIGVRNETLSEKAIADAAAILRPAITPGSRIASDSHWNTALFLAYHLNTPYYGQAAPHAAAQQFEAQLRRYRIQYLFLWTNPAAYPFLAGRQPIAAPALGRLRVYRIDQ